MPKSKHKTKKGNKKRGGTRSARRTPAKVSTLSSNIASHKPMMPTIDLDSTDIAALKQQAATCMRARQFEGAAKVFQRMTELAPENAQFFNDLATACAMSDKLPKARMAQARAMELAPDVFKYKANMTKVMILQKDFISADELLGKIMPLAEGDRAHELEQLKKVCTDELAGLFGKTPISDTSEIIDTTPKREHTGESGTISNDFSSAKTAEQPVAESLAPSPVLEQATDTLNILFVQEAPCIRNYKTATALRARGHKVTLLYTKARLSQMYKGLSDDVYDRCIQMHDHKHLWDISAKYDVVHCHNEPDHLTITAMAGEAPVIHDTHDLISLRAGGDTNLTYFEGMANRGADGRIYTTPYQLEAAKSLYGVKGPSLVFYNYTSAADLPRRFLPKLSAADGKTHIVYEGGIGGNGHRDFGELFVSLANHGVHVHIYPVHFDPNIDAMFSAYPLVHYHQPKSPKEIMEEMTQYDIGIIPFNIAKGNKQFLDSTIANKLHEYMAAGLPVITSPLQSYVDYFRTNRVGKVFKNAEDIINSLDELKNIAATTDLRLNAKTYEGEVTKLEDFYRQIIAKYKGMSGELEQCKPTGGNGKDHTGMLQIADGMGGTMSFNHTVM